MNYAIRFTESYETIKTTVSDWSLKSEKVLCYQHTGSKTEKVHCHLLLVGCSITPDQLKNLGKSHGLSGKGNGYWSFKTSFKDKSTGAKFPITDETIPKYICYMSKGIYDPLFNKGYEPDFLVDCKSKWKAPSVQYGTDVIMYKEFEDYYWDTSSNERQVYWEHCGKDEEAANAFYHKVLDTAKARKNAIVAFVMGRRKVWNRAAGWDINMLTNTFNYYHKIYDPESSN